MNEIQSLAFMSMCKYAYGWNQLSSDAGSVAMAPVNAAKAVGSGVSTVGKGMVKSVEDLKGGIEKDWAKVGDNFRKTWRENEETSPYKSFANYGPIMAGALMLSPLAFFGGRGAYRGIKGMLQKKPVVGAAT